MRGKLAVGAVVVLVISALTRRRNRVNSNNHRIEGADSECFTQTEVATSADTLEPLTRVTLIRRSLEIFPAGYLANISIIQGVALGLLVAQSVPSILDTVTALDLIAIAGQAMLLLFSIIIVSYEYLWFTTIMRWPSTFRDTAVPYVLGVAEITPSLLFDHVAGWWASTAIFMLLGAAGFFNTITRLHLDSFNGSIEIFGLVRRLLYRLVGLALSAAAMSGTTAYLLAAYDWDVFRAVVPWAILLTVTLIVGINERALNQLYEHYKVHRRPTRAGTWAAIVGDTS